MRSFVLTVLCCAGCTLATDAGDRQVDPSLARDLSYTFKSMSAHAGVALDVVLAKEVQAEPPLRLRSHARIVMPLSQAGAPYPDVLLTLSKVMTADPERLLFYADTNDDNVIQYDILKGDPGAEHIWDEPVDTIGIGEFVHSTNFKNFFEKDYSINAASIVLGLATDAPDWAPPACANGRDHTLEVRVIFSPELEAREIGYYRNYASNPTPTAPIVLEDTVDSKSSYLFEVLVDGLPAKAPFTMVAPEVGNLVVDQATWYPASSTVSKCE